MGRFGRFPCHVNTPSAVRSVFSVNAALVGVGGRKSRYQGCKRGFLRVKTLHVPLYDVGYVAFSYVQWRNCYIGVGRGWIDGAPGIDLTPDLPLARTRIRTVLIVEKLVENC